MSGGEPVQSTVLGYSAWLNASLIIWVQRQMICGNGTNQTICGVINKRLNTSVMLDKLIFN